MQNPQKPAKAKQKINLPKAVGWTMTGLGGVSLIASVTYASQILAFIGLGMIFWGIILTYIQTEEYIKQNLFDATTLSSFATLNRIIQELGYKGKAIYLPPKYLKDPEANKVYISKHEEWKIPKPEQIQEQEAKLFIENPQGVLLTPPGSELTKLFEKTLETSLTRIDLQYLQRNMPKLFVEDLEIAQNLEIEIENDKVCVRIEGSAYKSLTKEAANSHSTMGCPISSAIACALAKATGKPIIMENLKITENDEKMEIEYRILEEEQRGQ